MIPQFFVKFFVKVQYIKNTTFRRKPVCYSSDKDMWQPTALKQRNKPNIQCYKQKQLKLMEVNKIYHFLYQGTRLWKLPRKCNGQMHST